MATRKRSDRDPESAERREIVKGGLLAAAAALGFLPGCGDGDGSGAEKSDAAGAGAAPPAGGPTAKPGSDPVLPPGTSSSAGSAANAAGAGGSGGSAAAGSSGTGTGVGAGSGAGGAGDPGMMPEPMPTMPGQLPRAMLGKTGVSIPIIGLGTSRLGQRGGTPNAADFANMLTVFEAALDMGIEYVDTGATYGRAEEALGELIPSRRDKIFLVTKLYADSRSQAQTMFERSLQRLKTDHVDLLHLHSVGERNIDTALSQNGAWTYINEQKAAGKTRFVGITGHNNPANFTRMLATDQVDVLMTIMNFVDHSTYGFSRAVREDAVARGCGVMAMKVFGGTESVLRPGGGLANSDSPEAHPSNMELAFDAAVLPDCMRFVKSLPGVTGMVIGVNFIAELQRNIEWAIETTPFSDTELDAIVKMGETMAPMWASRYG
jgi:predicted aldo/keto reductase-like oxidoreductase